MPEINPTDTAAKLRNWVTIIIGCTIMAAGYVVFINPYNIVPGGVYGASIVLHTLFPGIAVGTFGYMFDIPLLIISVIFLGSKLGSRTIVAALLMPTIMNILTALAYPDAAAQRSLDPSLLLGGVIDLSDHLLLSVIIGSLVVGCGCGLIAKSQATSGGTDIVALLLQKYVGIPFSRAIFLADGCVVLFGLIVFSMTGSSGGQNALILSLYSLIAIYLMSRTISQVLSGMGTDKVIYVVSKRSPEEMRNFILHDLERTATCIKCSGLYSLQDKDMLFLVVNEKELLAVKRKIREYDHSAFVVVTDASATYGEGWRKLPDVGEIIPE